MAESVSMRRSSVAVHGGEAARPAKRAKTSHGIVRGGAASHPLLDQYFPVVLRLRDYLLSKLPRASRLRRRKIANVGTRDETAGREATEVEIALGRVLDTTFVGLQADVEPADDRWEQWVNFSQQTDESHVTLSGSCRLFSQEEIVDFVVWLLFSREKKAGVWPNHLLCDGFRRNVKANQKARAPGGPGGAAIPGLFSVYPNHRVQAIKEDPWPQLLLLLGKAGERIMIDLLLDGAIFTHIDAGRGNLYQLSGPLIAELKTLAVQDKAKHAAALSPCEVTFVKSRMLYARAAVNARGLVTFGLRHIHVLNRFPCAKEQQLDATSTHILMYMFPRQFGLHNVFTSAVDRKQTAQKFQDYTLREDEISHKFGESKTPHVPKRLKGRAPCLVRKLQVLHGRCSYSELLWHHCPVQDQVEALRKTRPSSSAPKTTQAKARRKNRHSLDGGAVAPALQYSTLVDLASPISHVSAYCRAVLAKIVPDGFWGTGAVMEHNREVFSKKVDHFVRLRRFENMSLHDLMQGMKITEIEWLTPPGLEKQKCSQSDLKKRSEIFHEFLYYLFDSILIPLIRSNFYVTESNTHRCRLFFFRHDVWRAVAEPAMALLKAQMFDEIKLDDAMGILNARSLGFSQVRLLPKGLGMRPIMNLRRRTVAKGDKKQLGPSINTILGPINSVLKLEKKRAPDLLGSSMFSVGDMYERIKAFKARPNNQKPRPLFFAKADVKAAFDTIPQDAVLQVMRDVPAHAKYTMAKHVEVQPSRNGANTTRKWHSEAFVEAAEREKVGEKAAVPNGMAPAFRQLVEGRLAATRRETVFSDSVFQKRCDTASLLGLLDMHVRQNVVRVGKKYYRQRNGIPQGSVLSSALCSYFYARLEAEHLAFLRVGGEDEDDDCLLLRLIDDFLLITTDRAKATRFVATMHAGMPEYGVAVSAGKTLVNFDMAVGGVTVPRVADGQPFPYCGTLIDCSTLDMAKDRENKRDPLVFNSLTVEFSCRPGQTFKRKVLNAFKIQSHLMFFDTAHNAQPTMLTNLHSAFSETATKMWAYARCLGRARRPSPRLVIDTIRSVVDIAYLLLTSKTRTTRHPGYKCAVTRLQVAKLAMVAFREVLVRKQAAYGLVIAWLDAESRRLSDRKPSRLLTWNRTVRPVT